MPSKQKHAIPIPETLINIVFTENSIPTTGTVTCVHINITSIHTPPLKHGLLQIERYVTHITYKT